MTLTSSTALGPEGAHVTDVTQVLAELTLAIGDDGMQQLLVHDGSFQGFRHGCRGGDGVCWEG